MVTIKMIAKECGYSVATVSKALNDASDISAETRIRIRKVADKMGYTPNAAARMLKTSRSFNFGVLFDGGLSHPYFSKILESFKKRTEELGYDISFISDHMGGREVSYVEHVRYRNYDGVLIMSGEYNDPQLLELATSGIPVVTIDYVFDNCSSVISDNIQGMADLVRYAYSKGHRKIAYIHGESTPVTRNRVASFCRTCKELGLKIPEEYLVQSPYVDAQAAQAATKKLLDLPDPPTCILYPDDLALFGALNELTQRGLALPEDISIAGYDGVAVGQMLKNKLTTLRQDTEQIGILAAEELTRTVEMGRAYLPSRLVVPGQLLPGMTVKDINPK